MCPLLWFALLCDALGNPLRFFLTAGQRHDSQTAPELIKDLQAKALIADKAYDSDKLVKLAQAQGMQVIISCRARRSEPRPLDEQRYEARHLTRKPFPAYEGVSPCRYTL